MNVMNILLVIFVVSVVKSNELDYSLGNDFLQNVLYDVYASEDYENTREKTFLYKMWPEISALVYESVKIPEFQEKVGSTEYLHILETKLWPKVGRILNIDFITGRSNDDYIVDAELEFTKPLQLNMYKEDTSRGKHSETSVVYPLKGESTIRFWLRVPELSKIPQREVPAKCVVIIDSISIKQLSELTIDESESRDSEVRNVEVKVSNILKGSFISDMMGSSIMRSLEEKLIERENNNNKRKEIRYEESMKSSQEDKSWVCLGSKLINKVISNKEKGKPSESEDKPKGEYAQSKIVGAEDISYETISGLQFEKAIQLFIKYSETINYQRPPKNVYVSDCMDVDTKVIYPQGFDFVLSNPYKFTSYAPDVFRHIRELFDIGIEHFVKSFCEAPIMGHRSPGASGSTLYISTNKQFVAKTIEWREKTHLRELLPNFLLHIYQNSHTLLPEFYGLYEYDHFFQNEILFVSNNVFPSDVEIHEKYDLKGSKYNRQVFVKGEMKKNPTYRDLDFDRKHPHGIYLDESSYINLIKTIKRDVRMLEHLGIIDYSFLLGLHYLDGDATPMEKSEPDVDTCTGTGTESTGYDHKDKDITSGIPAKTASGKRLQIFVGIIDVLQRFDLDKITQHYIFSLVVNPEHISIHEPTFYARRFVEYLSTKVYKTSSSRCKDHMVKK